MENTEITFPNNRIYRLSPERNLVHKWGWNFPSEIEERPLFVTGLSGTGKSTYIREICKQENVPYSSQTFVFLGKSPEISRSPYTHNSSFSDLFNSKFIDGHFLFKLPSWNKPIHAHSDEVCSSDYDSLNLESSFNFGDEIKEKIIFEFRQLEPTLIQEARKRREEEKLLGNSLFKHHTYRPHSEEQIKKGEYLLYQTAHKLFEQGADVYIRTRFDGDPLRFVE